MPDLNPDSWIVTSPTDGRRWIVIQEASMVDTQLGSRAMAVAVDNVQRIQSYDHIAVDIATKAQTVQPGMSQLVTADGDIIDTLYEFPLLTAAILGIPWPLDANGVDTRLVDGLTPIDPLAPPA